VKVAVKEQQVLNDLNDIIIPEIELRQSSIQDALAFLQKAAADDPKKRGIHICTAPRKSASPTAHAVLLGGGYTITGREAHGLHVRVRRKVAFHGRI